MSETGWFDEDSRRLVRPFAMARGRTRPDRYDLDMITLVVAVAPPERRRADPGQAEILEICSHPLSVAEVAAKADLPMVVVKVLLSDLIESGDVIFRPPVGRGTANDPDLLRAVLDGLRRL
ncbi:DUF742 domain-containing protein [Pseudonocardia ailaonensis]|uniref:DUF742 domain-containing protein n=1 Tax=Pseudonocardia ailaonensis TaxID=367279 RepID=A0ABN2NR89_9PSEU